MDYSVGEAETVDTAVARSVTAVRLMSRLGGAERRRASRLCGWSYRGGWPTSMAGRKGGP